MVGIICFWDRFATPYLSKYEELLCRQHFPYEVVIWNRTGNNRSCRVQQDNNIITINQFCNTGGAKLISFLKWRRVIIRLLQRKKYTHLIILSTMPAILLEDYLLLNYKDKYIFDIRDYTLEAFWLFRKLVMKLVNKSCLTPISSKGFLKWLEPSCKLMVNHNITIGESNGFDAPDFAKIDKVRFSFVGNVRLDTQTEAMLTTLGKSHRIEQHYYGRVLPNCNIDKVIINNQLPNVFLHGPFEQNDKEKIYANTDLINTVYANAKKEENIPLSDSTPLPNRLYDALVFYRPLVISKGTYLAELSDMYHLGVTINGFDQNIEEQILNYLHSFDKDQFKKGCDALLRKVMNEENAFIDKIIQILSDWKW